MGNGNILIIDLCGSSKIQKYVESKLNKKDLQNRVDLSAKINFSPETNFE